MGSAVALLVLVIACYVIVSVGAIAYELTGLDRSNARFQALSAFTNCGFTTRAAERVVEHPVRRQITMVLITLGYAGLASVVATLMRSVESSDVLFEAEAVIGLGVGAWLTLLFFKWRGLDLRLADRVRRWLLPRVTGERVPHEDLLFYKRGYGITRIEIPPHSRVAGLRLRDTDLRSFGLQVIAVEDHGEINPVPDADQLLSPGLHLVVYGKVAAVQEAFAPPLVEIPNDPAEVEG